MAASAIRWIISAVFLAVTLYSAFAAPSPSDRLKRAPQCGANETSSNCEACHENRCPMKNSSAKLASIAKSCPETCTLTKPICRCKDGYYRFNKLCLKLDNCPATCADNERVANCAVLAPWCQPSCAGPQGSSGNLVNETSKHLCQWQVCDVPTCVCKDGYVRDDLTLACVPIASCGDSKKSGH